MEENNKKTYKLTINRKKAYVGCLIAFKIFIDNVEVAKVKNGKTITLDVTEGSHTISVNDKNAIILDMTGDTTVEVAVLGSNSFGIVSVNTAGKEIITPGIEDSYIKKSIKQSKILLGVNISATILFVILIFTMGVAIQPWIFGILVGYACVNINGAKNIKNVDEKAYKQVLNTNIISIIIPFLCAIIGLVLISMS